MKSFILALKSLTNLSSLHLNFENYSNKIEYEKLSLAMIELKKNLSSLKLNLTKCNIEFKEINFLFSSFI